MIEEERKIWHGPKSSVGTKQGKVIDWRDANPCQEVIPGQKDTILKVKGLKLR